MSWRALFRLHHMGNDLIDVDGARLCIETFGEDSDSALLLIAGATSSMDWWDADLCHTLAAGGRLVIRYDHRDTGASSSAPAGSPDYTAADLVNDPIAILDALGIDRAHLVGLSMGGGIAQQVTVGQPDRVSSLTLIATTPAGQRSAAADLPPPAPQVAVTFSEPAPDPDWTYRDALIGHIVEGERPFAGTLGFDEGRIRAVAQTVVDRTNDIRAAMTNHWLLDHDGGPAFAMVDISVPTLVLHGTADPLFPVAHGAALAAEIPDATLVRLEGMGHEYPPPQLWDVVVPALLEHTAPRR